MNRSFFALSREHDYGMGRFINWFSQSGKRERPTKGAFGGPQRRKDKIKQFRKETRDYLARRGKWNY